MQKINEGKNNIKLFSLVSAALLTAVCVALAPLNIYIPLFGSSSLRFSVADIPIFICGVLFGPVLGMISGALGDVLGWLVAPAGPYFPGFTLNRMIVGVVPGVIFYLQRKGIGFEDRMIKRVNIGLMVAALIGAIFYINVIAIEEIRTLNNMFTIPLNVVITIAMIISVIVLGIVFWQVGKALEKRDGIYKLQTVVMAISINYIIVSLLLSPIWVHTLYNVPVFASIIARVFKSIIDVPLQVVICYVILQAIPVKVRQRIVCL